MNHELVRLSGGQVAVRSVVDQEVMHPGVGPRAEAETLYVAQSRLAARLRLGALTLFDVGLGAGSNAVAARAVSERRPTSATRLTIVSYERDLGALRLALDNADALGFDDETASAARALLTDGVHETERTRWILRDGDVRAALPRESERADVVFWDPFSPKANPELWSIAAFSSLRKVASQSCTLFTYSASTATRVALLAAGWAVGVGDPIGEKAHTTAAAVRAADLSRALDSKWLDRVRRSDAPMPPDADEETKAKVERAPQFR